MYGFPCEMDFSPLVSESKRDSETRGEKNPSHMENHTKCISCMYCIHYNHDSNACTVFTIIMIAMYCIHYNHDSNACTVFTIIMIAMYCIHYNHDSNACTVFTIIMIAMHVLYSL